MIGKKCAFKSFLDDPKKLALFLIFPALLVIFAVLIFPMLISLGMSFTGLKLTDPLSNHFIGLQNYIKALGNPAFWAAFRRTGYFALITVGVEVTLGLAIALLLNQKFVGRGLVRGLVILPWALPYVVNGMMWKWIFDANYGAFNALLTQIGLLDNYYIWLGRPSTAMHVVILANIWKETPVAIILILAGLQSIPEELYEASMVAGATWWQSFKLITLPILKPVLLMTIILKIIWALKEFDLIYVMTRGGPANATNLLSFHIYLNTFKFLKFGYGSALAYILAITSVLIALVYLKVNKSSEDM